MREDGHRARSSPLRKQNLEVAWELYHARHSKECARDPAAGATLAERDPGADSGHPAGHQGGDTVACAARPGGELQQPDGGEREHPRGEVDKQMRARARSGWVDDVLRRRAA